MIRLIASLQRVFATFVAVVPLVAGTDCCTVGALTGHASMVCVAQAEAAMSCHVQTPQSACPYCAPAAPAPPGSQPRGGTCCDLKPQAPAAAQQPSLAAPFQIAHAAFPVVTVLPAPASAWHGQAVPASDGSPPGEIPAPLSPRAPPLS
jgi:hypothetical protein